MKKNKIKKARRRMIYLKISASCAFIILVNIVILILTGTISPNRPDKSEYPVMGVRIESSVGEVSFKQLKKQNISFAYIRATKGISFIDNRFNENLHDCEKNDILTGLYHCFSFGCDGKKQAEHFFTNSGSKSTGRLIPAVEITLYGIYAISPKEKDECISMIGDFLDRSEELFGVKPMIMCGKRVYELYISGEFDEYPLWLKDNTKPTEYDGWEFLEYSKGEKFTVYGDRQQKLPTAVFFKEKEGIESLKI